MENKKIIPIILIITAILIGVAYTMINQNLSQQLSLDAEKDVCDYLSKISPYDCDNHECIVKNDKGDYWDIFYRCPGLKHFSLGQEYRLNVDKKSGNIEVKGLTN